MPKLFQICVEPNKGSVGRIAEQIGIKVISNGWKSYIAYGRPGLSSVSNLLKIGNIFDLGVHLLLTRIFDFHGFGSYFATKRFLKKIESINPDIILLHHLHGYFINIEVLFAYLNKRKYKVFWVFHDSWVFTGHCAHFDYIGCNKWKSECGNCPQKGEYPKSWFLDRSKKNFQRKKSIFIENKDLNIISVSNWMSNLVGSSFLNKNKLYTIHNGIDIIKFNRVLDCSDIINRYKLNSKVILLGVASIWDKKKGLNEFLRLRKILDLNNNSEFLIILIGLSDYQINSLPSGILGIKRTESIKELATFYSLSDVYINLTLEDTYPTTNLESIACGTPVLTYNTGGSKESIINNTGIVVDKGNLTEVYNGILSIINNKKFYTQNCRQVALDYFDANLCFEKYFQLFKSELDFKKL